MRYCFEIQLNYSSCILSFTIWLSYDTVGMLWLLEFESNFTWQALHSIYSTQSKYLTFLRY